MNRMLLEGTHVVDAADKAGCELDAVCCSPEWQSKNPRLTSRLRTRCGRFETVEPMILKGMTTTIEPDGVVAAAARRLVPARDIPLKQILVILKSVQDPGNAGTVIRSAAAVGADGVWLTDDSVEPDHPKVIRASAGAWFKMPVAVVHDIHAELHYVKKCGMQLVATDAGASTNYWDISFKRPTAVILGNEGAGLPSDIIERADRTAKIPMLNEVESVNVGVVAALVLFEIRRQTSLHRCKTR